MNIQVFYNENGRTFEDIIKEFLLMNYDLEYLDILSKYA